MQDRILLLWLAAYRWRPNPDCPEFRPVASICRDLGGGRTRVGLAALRSGAWWSNKSLLGQETQLRKCLELSNLPEWHLVALWRREHKL